jgi:hypothetical protein
LLLEEYGVYLGAAQVEAGREAGGPATDNSYISRLFWQFESLPLAGLPRWYRQL